MILQTSSTQAVMRSNILAKKLGINTADRECMELLLTKGRATAGEIASETLLSTGAITKMLDRLEKGQFVSRQLDAGDRRKVYVVPNHQKIINEVVPLFQKSETAMKECLSKYSTAELDLIFNFIKKANDISREDLAGIK